MPELDPVRQDFIANAEAYLAALDDIIAKTSEAAVATEALEEKLAHLGETSDAVAELVSHLGDTTGDTAESMDKLAAATEVAAGRENDLRDSSVALSVMQRDLADASADLMMQTALLASIEEKLGAIQRDTADSSLDLMGMNTLLADSFDRLSGQIAGVTRNLVLMRTAGLGAGRSLDDAGNSARRLFGWFRLTSNSIHWIIAGTAELLAVLVPATVAAGAWAFAWLQGATNVYQHLQSLFGATEALGQAAGQTYGELLGLRGVWQQIQNEANVDVYAALGGGINVLRESFGGLAQVGLRTGQVFDTFMARLVYDFSAAGQAGGVLSQVLSHMESDLVDLGRVFGNLGAAIASMASQMPGLAEVLLSLLAGLTGLIKDVVEFASVIHIGSWSVLTMVMALEEFNRWGSLAVSGLGKLSLATTELSGKTGSYFLVGDRFIGILKNLIGVLPMLGFALASAAAKIPVFGAAVIGTQADIAAARAATMEWIASLSTLETFGIVAVAAGLGFLIDKIVTARTAAQELTSSLQATTQKATAFSVFTTIAENLQILSTAEMQATANLNELNAAPSQGAAPWRGYAEAVSAAQQKVSQLNAGTVQQISDAGQVVTSLDQLSKAYGLSVPQAMGAAEGAGQSLTAALQNQNGQWTAAGDKIRDYIQGLRAMGVPAGAVGQDMLALAVQTGEAGSKMEQLNQAWDAFMSDITGGTSALGSFRESMQNIGQVVGDTANNLGEAASISLSTKQFADALQGYGDKGAQAWTNFDQVVGSTAPELIDWLRTAGTMGAATGQQVSQAGLDMVSALIPLAAKSATAKQELLTLAQDAGVSAQTFPQLESAVKSTHASVGGLNSIVNTTTGAMGNMAQDAEALGNTMNDALSSAMSTAALKASGFYGAESQLTQAIKTYGANSPQAEAAARRLTKDWDAAEQAADSLSGSADRLRQSIDRLPSGKTVHINVELTGNGVAYLGSTSAGSTYVQAPGGGYVGRGKAEGGLIHGPGTGTSDSVLARLSNGEYVMPAAAVHHWGTSMLDAMAGKRYAAGGAVAAAALPVAAAGGGTTVVHLHATLPVMLDGEELNRSQITQTSIWQRRNSSNFLNLRVR